MKTEQMWKARHWPCRNGIYLANDTVRLLDVSMPWDTKDGGLIVKVAEMVPLVRLEEVKNNRTTRIGWNDDQMYSDPTLCVIAGEGSHGSEGFVAVTQKATENLVWLLYLNCSNPFERVTIRNGIVTAFSTLGHVWQIPVMEPEQLKASVLTSPTNK